MEWQSVEDYWDWAIREWGGSRLERAFGSLANGTYIEGVWHGLSCVSKRLWPEHSPTMEAKAAIRRARVGIADRQERV